MILTLAASFPQTVFTVVSNFVTLDLTTVKQHTYQLFLTHRRAKSTTIIQLKPDILLQI